MMGDWRSARSTPSTNFSTLDSRLSTDFRHGMEMQFSKCRPDERMGCFKKGDIYLDGIYRPLQGHPRWKLGEDSKALSTLDRKRVTHSAERGQGLLTHRNLDHNSCKNSCHY